MNRLLVLLLSATASWAQVNCAVAATEPPAPVDAAPPAPALAPATPSVQGGPGAVAPPPGPSTPLPDVDLPKPPAVSPAAGKKVEG